MPRATPKLAPKLAPLLAPLVALVLSVSLLAGCSGGGEDEPAPDAGPSASATTSSDPAETAAEPALATRARNGSVTGRIKKGDRKDVVERVARIVDRWLEAAYVAGDYPRKATSFGERAWPGFTVGATRTARADRDLMSNADIAERIEGVTVKRRDITVDVLAVDGTARAATGRVHLTFRTEGLDRLVTVTGRVFLTKKDGQWRVFGYDVAKARV